MATLLATLLTRSDVDELREVLDEWRAQAVTDAQRSVMDRMAGQILDLKAALREAPREPTREELEDALRVMLRLAGGAVT